MDMCMRKGDEDWVRKGDEDWVKKCMEFIV